MALHLINMLPNSKQKPKNTRIEPGSSNKKIRQIGRNNCKRAADAINVFSTLSATIDSTALRSARDLRRQLEMTDKAVSSLEANYTGVSFFLIMNLTITLPIVLSK